MRIKNKLIKKLLNIFYYVFVISCFVYGIGSITYATANQNNSPDVIVTINQNGGHTHTGDLFGNELWYPGKEKDGVIRIINNYKQANIEDLGLTVSLNSFQNGLNRDIVYNSFLNNMKLTIRKGSLLTFNHTIIEEKSLLELLEEGFKFSVADRIGIGKSMDLEYTLKMDEKAGNELENLSANINFIINANEVSESGNGGGSGDNGNGGSQPVVGPYQIATDIDGHWAHDCIIALLNHGIIDLEKNGTVRPDEYITRAETAELLARALGLEPIDKIFSGYIDPLPKKYRGYIIATSEAKVFRGYPGKLFKANKNITREELSCVFIRAFNKKVEQEVILGFSDKEQISTWALEDVKAGVVHNIISGYPDNTFRSQNNMTRAEGFTIVCKLLGYHGEHKI